MEGRIISGKLNNAEFQVLERVFLDEFHPKKIKNVETSLSDVELQSNKELECKDMNLWTEFSQFDDMEVIRLILSYVRNDNIMLDKPYPIMKEIILVISGLCGNGDILAKK